MAKRKFSPLRGLSKVEVRDIQRNKEQYKRSKPVQIHSSMRTPAMPSVQSASIKMSKPAQPKVEMPKEAREYMNLSRSIARQAVNHQKQKDNGQLYYLGTWRGKEKWRPLRDENHNLVKGSNQYTTMWDVVYDRLKNSFGGKLPNYKQFSRLSESDRKYYGRMMESLRNSEMWTSKGNLMWHLSPSGGSFSGQFYTDKHGRVEDTDWYQGLSKADQNLYWYMVDYIKDALGKTDGYEIGSPETHQFIAEHADMSIDEIIHELQVLNAERKQELNDTISSVSDTTLTGGQYGDMETKPNRNTSKKKKQNLAHLNRWNQAKMTVKSKVSNHKANSEVRHNHRHNTHKK